jgi:hypothetical protein
MYYRFDQKTKNLKNKLRPLGIALFVALCGATVLLFLLTRTQDVSQTFQATEETHLTKKAD